VAVIGNRADSVSLMALTRAESTFGRHDTTKSAFGDSPHAQLTTTAPADLFAACNLF
jgi:hypothetical protein